MKKVLTSMVVAIGLMVTAGTAFAASDPTASQYHSDPGQAAGAVRSASNVAGLPVTGLDLLGLVVVAAALVAFGIAMIRISRPDSR